MIIPEKVPDKFPCLVWLPGLKGNEPQLWHMPIFKDQVPVKVLAFMPLTELKAGVKLSDLIKVHPYHENIKLATAIDVDNYIEP